jgi:serine/threonine protein kinase/Tfp pilus assembly protein PilF
MAILTGTRFDQYEVTAPLGKGGMGEVCLAEDTRLQRKVALKLLPAEFTQDSERLRRFALEAHTASGLNHPNIITIYDIGAAHNTHYIATEFIAGQTLRERLQRPLLLDETLSLTLQIAQALAAAHDANIIHRDIKPENVMLRSDGIVKVLDFGLAKLVETQKAEHGTRNEEEVETLLQDDANIPRSSFSDQHSTMPGTVMGTASYMSPEQARGERVDARTDLFSLGVVLYELLAGQRPFAGVNMIDILGAILNQEPAPLSDAPAELQRIVTKALQKDRAARYQTAQELAHDLQGLKDELAYQARAARTSSEQPTLLQAPATTKPADEQASRVPPLGGDAGDQASPPKGGTLDTRRHGLRFSLIALAVMVLAVAAFFYFKRQPALTDKDTILLTDFTNTTGDAVFDGTLKQALAVHLGQSPFLNLFADERVRETLRLMNRSPDERVTPSVGREICQRQGLKALLTGTIASLGRNYVISLEAVNGQTGDVLAREQGEAEGKEQVLRTLGEAASRMRGKLGESLSSIQKFDKPLEQVTTSSLEAFKAFSLGWEQGPLRGKWFEAIPFLKRAIEIDPNFAFAHALLSAAYSNTSQTGLMTDSAARAFPLLDRVSEREKFYILDSYYMNATGQLDKAIEAIEMWKRTYPRDWVAANNLSVACRSVGQFERAVEEANETIRRDPNVYGGYVNLASALLYLNRLAEAKENIEQTIRRKGDTGFTHSILYAVAFVNRDTETMRQQIAWAQGKPDEFFALDWQTGSAAFGGQWKQAQDFSRRAIDLATRNEVKAVAAQFAAEQALRAAVMGQPMGSLPDLTLKLERNQITLPRTALALALSGTASQVKPLTDELGKQYPQDTLINGIWLPTIKAALELPHGNAAQAIEHLQSALRYEAAAEFWPQYVRGQAYLKLNKGAEAMTEFQKIIDHRGQAPLSPLYPLAHLGLTRAALLQGDTAKAQKSYQEFFALWKDADADLPVLIEAKKEYEKVK